MGDWDSAQYERFARERTQPARDLIARLSGLDPQDVLDIGSGPGNSTAALAKAFPHASILGVDSSPNMLARACAAHPELSFAPCTVPAGLPELDRQFDLVFSNACIHWIPDQEELIRAIFGVMRPGATLAVQIPLTQRAPFYQVLGELVSKPGWAAELGSVHNFHNLSPEGYYDLLAQVAASFDIWETTYYHRVASVAQVMEWYRGSGLRPYLEALPASERPEFEAELLSRLSESGEYPVRADGTVILKMPRLFVVATKGE